VESSWVHSALRPPIDLLRKHRVITMMKKLVELWLARETQVLGENLPQCQFVQHKPHMLCPDANPGRRGGKPAWAVARPGVMVGTPASYSCDLSGTLRGFPPPHEINANALSRLISDSYAKKFYRDDELTAFRESFVRTDGIFTRCLCQRDSRTFEVVDRADGQNRLYTSQFLFTSNPINRWQVAWNELMYYVPAHP
jgi:hypothetical protein